MGSARSSMRRGRRGPRRPYLAGCTTIEHGNRLTDEVLDLMVKHGTYFDSNNHLLLHNYLENKEKFFGIGNYNEEGFRYMAEGLPVGNDTFKRALAKGVKIVQGTDAVAGSHGRLFEEMIYRVRDGGQKPMDAIVAATSTAAESLNMATADRHDRSRPAGRHHRARRQPARRHHRSEESGVRDEGRQDLQERAPSRQARQRRNPLSRGFRLQPEGTDIRAGELMALASFLPLRVLYLLSPETALPPAPFPPPFPLPPFPFPLLIGQLRGCQAPRVPSGRPHTRIAQ